MSNGRVATARRPTPAGGGTGIDLPTSQPSSEQYELRDPDVRLMLEVRAGSAEAFEELVLRYQSRLITVFEHLVGQRDLADDLAQEVFLRIFRARHSYVPGSKFSTWLFTIANNVASNALRSRSRRREVHLAPRRDTSMPEHDPLAELALAASGLMPTRQLDRAETRDVVRMALNQLSDRQRLAVLLNKFEGMSYADIAASMSLTPQAVKSLLSRARENLRDVLEPYLAEGQHPSADST